VLKSELQRARCRTVALEELGERACSAWEPLSREEEEEVVEEEEEQA
jgi:hypothetical protein